MFSACEQAGSRDFAFVGAVEISSLRLRLKTKLRAFLRFDGLQTIYDGAKLSEYCASSSIIRNNLSKPHA